jgi:hypothetical protein
LKYATIEGNNVAVNATDLNAASEMIYDLKNLSSVGTTISFKL